MVCLYYYCMSSHLGHYGNYGNLLDAVKLELVGKVVDFVLHGCRFLSPAPACSHFAVKSRILRLERRFSGEVLAEQT